MPPTGDRGEKPQGDADPARRLNCRSSFAASQELSEEEALLELAQWGAKHVARSVAPKHIARRIKKDREGLIEELKSSLK